MEKKTWGNHDLGVMVLYWCFTVVAKEWLLHLIAAREIDAKPLFSLVTLLWTNQNRPQTVCVFFDFLLLN